MGCDDTLGAYDGLCERSTVGSEVVGDLVVLPTMPCFVGLTIVVTEVVGLVIDAEEVVCSDDTISTNETISSKKPTTGDETGCFV